MKITQQAYGRFWDSRYFKEYVGRINGRRKHIVNFRCRRAALCRSTGLLKPPYFLNFL